MQFLIIQTLLLFVACGVLVTVMAVQYVKSTGKRVMDEKIDLFQDADWERADD